MSGSTFIAESGFGIGIVWEPRPAGRRPHQEHQVFAFWWDRHTGQSEGRQFVHSPTEYDDAYVFEVSLEAARAWINHKHFLVAPAADGLLERDHEPVEARFSTSLVGALRGLAHQARGLIATIVESGVDDELRNQCCEALEDVNRLRVTDTLIRRPA